MQIRFNASGFQFNAELEKYTTDKVTTLAKRLPHRLRAHAACLVEFKQVQRNHTKFSTCRLVLNAVGEEFRADETTQHMYAALDIATAQVEQQIRAYRRRMGSGGLRGRLNRGLHADWQ